MPFKDPFLIRNKAFHQHKTFAEIMRVLREEPYKENIDKSEYSKIISGKVGGPKAERIVRETLEILQAWKHGKAAENHAE